MDARIPYVVAAGLLLSSAGSNAAYLVNTGEPVVSGGVTTLNIRAGQFTVTDTVTIESVEHWVTLPADADVRFSIRANSSCTTEFGTNPCPFGNLELANDLFSGAFAAKMGGPAWIGLYGLDWVLTPGTYWLLRWPAAPVGASIFQSPFSSCVDGSAACGFFDGLDFEASWDFPRRTWGPNGARIGWRIGVAEVPEPGTLALLGIGLAGIGLSRRRRAR